VSKEKFNFDFKIQSWRLVFVF